MAKATLLPPTPPKPSILLELSFEEAKALLLITGKIVGSCTNSPRLHTTNVYDALENIPELERERLPRNAAYGTISMNEL